MALIQGEIREHLHIIINIIDIVTLGGGEVWGLISVLQYIIGSNVHSMSTHVRLQVNRKLPVYMYAFSMTV